MVTSSRIMNRAYIDEKSSGQFINLVGYNLGLAVGGLSETLEVWLIIYRAAKLALNTW